VVIKWCGLEIIQGSFTFKKAKVQMFDTSLHGPYFYVKPRHFHPYPHHHPHPHLHPFQKVLNSWREHQVVADTQMVEGPIHMADDKVEDQVADGKQEEVVLGQDKEDNTGLQRVLLAYALGDQTFPRKGL